MTDTVWIRFRRQINRLAPFYACSVIKPDGTPHQFPVGSLRLGAPGKAIILERFVSSLKEVGEGAPFCILATETGPGFWPP